MEVEDEWIREAVIAAVRRWMVSYCHVFDVFFPTDPLINLTSIKSI